MIIQILTVHARPYRLAGVCLFTLLGGYWPFDPTSAASPEEQRKLIAAGVPAYTAAQDGHPRQV